MIVTISRSLLKKQKRKEKKKWGHHNTFECRSSSKIKIFMNLAKLKKS